MNATHDAHRETQNLLPWFANGSLASTERERVQAHLQVCAACRAELATLHTLRAAGEDHAPDADPEPGLAALLARLDEPETPAAPAAAPTPAPALEPPRPATVPGWRARLAANDRTWLRAAVAAQFAAIAVLAGLLGRSAGGPEAPAGDYRVLGAAPAARSGLVVTFGPDTPERELRRIVLASGARVVGGPTATGAWLLDTAEPAGAVVARLRAEPAVTLAETLGAEGPP